MSTMTLTRPIRTPEPLAPDRWRRMPPGLRSRCVRLAAGPAAVPAARRQVQAAISTWEVPVDPADVALLTSELVTNAVRHAAGPVVTLVVTCSRGQVRVDVHDTSRALPEVADVPADAEPGRGLHLVASLAGGVGLLPHPAGKAVYFMLAFGPDLAPGPADAPCPGTVSRDSSLGSPSPAQPARRPRTAPSRAGRKSSLSLANGNCVEVAGGSPRRNRRPRQHGPAAARCSGLPRTNGAHSSAACGNGGIVSARGRE